VCCPLAFEGVTLPADKGLFLTSAKVNHFHIVWQGDLTDWQRHETRGEAEDVAKDLVQPDESYNIGVFTDDCPLCRLMHDAAVIRCKCAEHPIGRCRRAADRADGLCESCRENHKPRARN